jgi:hypothetical protein
LTEEKSDPNNKPTFSSCLVRIPEERIYGENNPKWNGISPKMPLEILTDFKAILLH